MAAESLQSIIKLIEQNEYYEPNITDIVKAVTEDNGQLGVLLDGLENQFVSVDTTKRKRAVDLLASVIQALPLNHMNAEEITNITTFFCLKLKDHHSLIPTILQALLSIVQMSATPVACVHQVVDALSADVQSQIHAPKDRTSIYKTLQYLLDNRLEDVKLMETRFVFAVLNLMDAECNARNLSLVFTFVPKMMNNFVLGHLAEDMFEALACYFPVDVPSEGPDVVSREVLKKKLEVCLASNAELAPHVIPLLLEKLDSTLIIAKKDSFSLLQYACTNKVWGAPQLEKYIKDLAIIIHREGSKYDELTDESHATAKAIVQALSVSVLAMEQDTVETAFINHILQFSEHALQQAEMRAFSPTSKLVACVSRGSPNASRIVCDTLLPLLISQFEARRNVPKQQASILAAINNFLSTGQPKTQIEKYECIPLYLDSCRRCHDVEIQGNAFAGLSAIATALSLEERQTLYRLLESGLISPIVCSTAVPCLCTLAKLYPEEILASNLFTSLYAAHGSESIHALCAVATSQPFLGRIVPHLMDMVVYDTLEPYRSQISHKEVDLDELRPLWLQQMYALQGFIKIAKVDTTSHYLCQDFGIIDKFADYWLCEERCEFQDTALHLSIKLISLLLREQPTIFQTRVLEQCLDMLGLADTTTVVNFALRSYFKAGFALGVISSLKQRVVVPEVCGVLLSLVHASVYCDHPFSRAYCSQLAACLLNKSASDTEVTIVFEQLESHMASSPQNAIVSFLRCMRGLLLRGHVQLSTCMDTLIMLLSHPDNGSTAADNIKMLVSEENEFLCAANHASVKLLYKQRLSQFLPALEQVYQSAEDARRNHILSAVVQMGHCMGHDVLAPFFSFMIPLMVVAVNNEASEQKCAMDCLQPLLAATSPILSSHLAEILKACIKVACTHKLMEVRILALDCVGHVGNYQESDIVSLRYDVLYGLKKAMSDSKRAVRHAAVTCAGRWHLLGSI